MASARRTGTNEQVTSFGNCTRTYTSLATWDAATDTDHVTDEETDVLECYDDASSFTAFTIFDGATNNSTYFRIIRAASGEGHDGTSNNGVFFTNTTAAHTFDMRDTDEHIQDLIISSSINSSTTFAVVDLSADRLHAIGVIAFDGTNAGSGTLVGFRVSGDDVNIILCLSENNAGAKFNHVPGSGKQVNYYNCVAFDAVSGAEGWKNENGTAVCKNCLSDVVGSNFEGGTYTGSDYNATIDTTDPDSGANNRQSQTFTFVDEGGNDFHLTLSDGGAKDFGQDLSGDSVFAFNDDIDGDRFSIWDIGFDENNISAGLKYGSLILLGVGV